MTNTGVLTIISYRKYTDKERITHISYKLDGTRAMLVTDAFGTKHWLVQTGGSESPTDPLVWTMQLES